MRGILYICAVALLAGCSQPAPAPGPAAARTNGYSLNIGEITNGVVMVFPSAPSSALARRLTDAGAAASSDGLSFVLPAVDSQARRDALTAALSAGATLPPK